MLLHFVVNNRFSSLTHSLIQKYLLVSVSARAKLTNTKTAYQYHSHNRMRADVWRKKGPLSEQRRSHQYIRTDRFLYVLVYFYFCVPYFRKRIPVVDFYFSRVVNRIERRKKTRIAILNSNKILRNLKLILRLYTSYTYTLIYIQMQQKSPKNSEEYCYNCMSVFKTYHYKSY